ncbi:MAG TPA: hypothetical protein VFE13_08995, partial [Caulobacteraceae bacterium]|nr:hypothetical protein [Caulobacteraceae bacterium]
PVGKLPRGGSGEQTAPGSLTVQGAAPETLAIKLSTRGITRRQADVCSFPPLRVEFTDKPPANSLFKGQKRLKLVTHCRPQASAEQYVLLEYAAYRLYNKLTPLSFDVRLATIDYVDDKGRPMVSRLGFFIEDADDVGKRNDLDHYKTQGHVPLQNISARDAARFVLFQHMISNLDWAMTAGPAGTDCCHNARLFVAEGATSNIAPAPYDFDFSGLVDAPYAVPPAGIKISNVRVRRYRGFCRHNAEVKAYAADLLGQRGALLAVLDETPKLNDGVRKKADAYLGEFFDQLGSPQGLASLEKSCLPG